MSRSLVAPGILTALALLLGIGWLAGSGPSGPGGPAELDTRDARHGAGRATPVSLRIEEGERASPPPAEGLLSDPGPATAPAAGPTSTVTTSPGPVPAPSSAADASAADPPPGPLEVAREARRLRVAARAEGDAASSSRTRRAEALERGFAPYVALLARGEKVRPDPAIAALLADAALRERFQAPEDAVVVEGPGWTPEGGVATHLVLRFPAGLHEFRPAIVLAARPLPRTVTVEGAGMDATALMGWSGWNAPKDGPRWTFRALTVHCSGHEFVHGGGPLEVGLFDARVVGCDTGAGGSEMFDASGLVFAAGCRFEEGFAGHGGTNLFVGHDLAVRLDGCTFVGPFGTFSRAEALVATECAFEWTSPGVAPGPGLSLEGAVPEDPPPDGERLHGSVPGRPVLFLGCTIRSVHDPKAGRWPERRLVDLNPEWVHRRW